MKKHIFEIIIVVLIIIALALGVAIYFVSKNSSQDTLTKTNNATGTIQAKRDLTTEELQFLNSLVFSKLTSTEKDRMMTLTNRGAIDGNQITVSASCQVSPFILRVRKDKNLIIKNADNKSHTLMINNHTYSENKNETKEIDINTLKLGVYRYGCDKTSAGYILTTK